LALLLGAGARDRAGGEAGVAAGPIELLQHDHRGTGVGGGEGGHHAAAPGTDNHDVDVDLGRAASLMTHVRASCHRVIGTRGAGAATPLVKKDGRASGNQWGWDRWRSGPGR